MNNFFRLVMFLLVLTGSRSLMAQDGTTRSFEFYGAPLVGATSLSGSDGTSNRDTKFTYGAESFLFKKHFGLGLSYLDYIASQDGNDSVSVSEEDRWITCDLKYRFFNEDLSPYLMVGGGEVFQTVTTTLIGQTEKNSGSNFVQSAGAGFFGHFAKNFGFNIGAKYFQFSNVNGFNYFLSFGYYDGNLF